MMEKIFHDGKRSYSTSPHDLALFVITFNCNSQQYFVKRAELFSPHD